MDDVAHLGPERAETFGVAVGPVCRERITDAANRPQIPGRAARRTLRARRTTRVLARRSLIRRALRLRRWRPCCAQRIDVLNDARDQRLDQCPTFRSRCLSGVAPDARFRERS